MLKSPNLPSQGPLHTSLHARRRTSLKITARGFGAHDIAAFRGKSRRDTVIVDIASLLKSSDSNESSVSSPSHTEPPPTSLPPPSTTRTTVATALSGVPTPTTTATTATTTTTTTSTFALAPPGPPSPPLPGGISPIGGGFGAPGLGGVSAPPPLPTLAQVQVGRTGGHHHHYHSHQYHQGRPGSGGGSGGGNKRNMPPHTSESPAKKQSKWSPEEDALIIELRGSGMKWDDISKRLPGRSAISCRLHYQNYLERRSEWDEERKNKLARLYERFKPEMWARVAEEMQVPWRAAEAMHWQLGEVDMARRAGVVPFSLTPAAGEPPGVHRSSPSRGHTHSQSQGSLPRDLQGLPSPRYGRGGHAPGPITPLIPPPLSGSGGRPLAARRESIPPLPSYMGPSEHLTDPGYGLPAPAIGLAPIQTSSFSQGRGGMLPSVAELTTGVSPYSTPAYSVGVPSASPVHSATASPGPYLPSLSSYPPSMQPQQQESPLPPPGGGAKRRGSPEYPGSVSTSRESSRRRQQQQPQQSQQQYPPPPPQGPPSQQQEEYGGGYPPPR